MNKNMYFISYQLEIISGIGSKSEIKSNIIGLDKDNISEEAV